VTTNAEDGQLTNLSEWDISDTVRPRAEFRVGTTLTDPTTITLVITDPSGNADTYTYGAAQITKESTGIFYKDIVVDEAGEWQTRFVGTGAAAAVVQSRFAVRRADA